MEFIKYLLIFLWLYASYSYAFYQGKKAALKKLQPHGEAPKVSTNEADGSVCLNKMCCLSENSRCIIGATDDCDSRQTRS